MNIIPPWAAKPETGSGDSALWPQLGSLMTLLKISWIRNSFLKLRTLLIHRSSHHMDELVSSAECEGWRPSCSCTVLIECEPALRDYKLQLLKVSISKWAVIPCTPPSSYNRNIHQGLLMKLWDRWGVRANTGGWHGWFEDFTKSRTLDEFKMRAGSPLLCFFSLFAGVKGCCKNQLQGRQRWTVCFSVTSYVSSGQ